MKSKQCLAMVEFFQKKGTQMSLIFLKLKNLVKQAVISRQYCTNGRRKTKSGHIILEFCSYLNLYSQHSATCR